MAFHEGYFHTGYKLSLSSLNRSIPMMPFTHTWTLLCGLLLVSIFGCNNSELSIPEETLAHSQTTAPSAEQAVEFSLPEDLSGRDIWSRLQQPETAYFVLMRHAIAPGTGDPANFHLKDCSTQRNLSEEGREQARRTGNAFRQQGVIVDRVLSSEWCRCLETAELMDLAPVEPFAPINSFFRDRSTEAAQTAEVEQFVIENSGSPSVTILVSHFVNIAALSDSGIASGEMVVMRLGEGEKPVVVGKIEPF